MATRRLLVEILGDDASLQRALGGSAAATAGFGDRLQSTGRRISGVGKTLTRDLTLPILAIGGVSAKAAIDFQNSMELLHTQANVGQKAVEQLSKGVLALAGPTATAPNELSKGLYHLASQGLRGKDALDALKASAEGAKLGQADLEDVTNALGATIVSKIGGVHSYTQAMGELNAIVGTGDMRMQDLADAMGTGLPANAKIAGVSLREIGGALATFGDNNIRGARAGTLLNSTLRIMSSPSGAAQKALAGVGISADELGNKLRSEGLVGALEDLKTKMEATGLTATQQGVLLTAAFGGRQATGVKILLDELDRLKTKTQEVGAAGGKFGSAWEAYTKTTAYHLASMGAQMQATGVTIGTVLLPVVAKIADFIGSLASKFEALSPTMQKAILIFAGVAAAIGPVVSVVGSLATAIGFLAANPIVLLIAGVGAFVAAVAAAVIWPNKLKAVLERMGLSARAAGEVVRGLQNVFHVVSRAVMELVGVIRDNWTQISAIIRGSVDIVKTVIEDAVHVIEALWRTFGATIVNVVKTYWSYVKNTIRNDLEIVRGVIDVITGLIHGDWSKVWRGITEIVGGALKQVVNIIRTELTLALDAAKLIGEGIYHGILLPIAHLATALLHAIESAITSAFHGIISWVVGAASSIGRGIVDGIIHGASGLASGLGSTLKNGAMSVLHSIGGFLGIGSPSRVFANKIGKPIAQGIIAGYLEGAGSLPSKISASMRKALEAGRQAVAQSQAKFTAAFSGVQSAVDHFLSGTVAASATKAGKQLTALLAQYKSPTSGPVSGADTAAGKQLAALQAAHDAAARAQALTDANSQLSSAQGQLATDKSGGADASTLAADQQAIVQAQQAVADAQYQIQVAALQDQASLQAQAANQQAAALQTQAAQEAKHETALRALRKHNADVALAELRTRLAKTGATQKQAQEAIVKLLKKYGVTYRDVAADMGKKFADGLEKSIHLTAKAAEELAKEIAKYLPHSPAEKGPLSKPLGWQEYLLADLTPAVGKVHGLFDQLANGATGGHGAARAAAARGDRGGRVHAFTGPLIGEVHIHADNYVGNKRELEEEIVNGLSRWARRNGRADLRAVLGAS